MQKFPDLTNFPFYSLALNTRPNDSLGVEATICGVTEVELIHVWENLENAQNRTDFEAACDRYIKLASVTIAEAAPELQVTAAYLLEVVREGSTQAFKHRGRWRIWKGHLTYFFSPGNFVPPRSKGHRRRRFKYFDCW